MNLLLDIGIGLAIGLSLALLGGGGSILTVPALVYLVGQDAHAAVSSSLAIVGINSAFGAYLHRGQNRLNGKVALVFGGAGMLTSYLSAGLSGLLSSAMLLTLFAVLMIAVAVLMLRPAPQTAPIADHHLSIPNMLLAGAAVGLLTGLLGVGGGFLIVPALVLWIGLPITQAIGTSLIVIAANSLVGFVGHLQGGMCDLTLTLVFSAAGMVGAWIGVRLSRRMSPETLRRAFAIFVLLLAIGLLYDNLPRLLIN